MKEPFRSLFGDNKTPERKSVQAFLVVGGETREQGFDKVESL